MKWNKAIKAQKWAELIKENIAYKHEVDIIRKLNVCILGSASVLLMLIVLVILLKGVIL